MLGICDSGSCASFKNKCGQTCDCKDKKPDAGSCTGGDPNGTCDKKEECTKRCVPKGICLQINLFVFFFFFFVFVFFFWLIGFCF